MNTIPVFTVKLGDTVRLRTLSKPEAEDFARRRYHTEGALCEIFEHDHTPVAHPKAKLKW